MAGYDGYSMSNNAVDAYESGEMPLSKWTKSEIIEQIMDCGIEFPFDKALFSKLTLDKLRDFLETAGWHHTSSHYNSTDFYRLNEERLEQFTAESITTLIKEKREKVILEKPEYFADCKFLTWSGSRAHPKATEHYQKCKIIGNWAYTDYGKKSIDGNGFKILKRYSEV